MRVQETSRVVCPSGLVGEVRALRVAEIMAMQDPKALRQGKVFNQLVQSCWVSTLEPGPYHFDMTKPPPWPHMLHCDKIVALREIRALTGGSDYEFEMKCSSCEHRYMWVQPLREMQTKPLPRETIEHVRQQQLFKLNIGDDLVEFRQLLNSDDEQLVRLTRDGVNPTTAGFICRIVKVTGSDGTQYTDNQELSTWIDNLGPIEYDELEIGLDKTDGGLILEVTAECPKCGFSEGVVVPLLLSISRSSIRQSNVLAKAKMEKQAIPGHSSTMPTPTQNLLTGGSGGT